MSEDVPSCEAQGPPPVRAAGLSAELRPGAISSRPGPFVYSPALNAEALTFLGSSFATLFIKARQLPLAGDGQVDSRLAG